MTRWSLFASIGACAGLAAWAWAARGHGGVATVAALLGLVWIFAETRGVRPAAYAGFLLAAVGAAVGEWQRLPPGLLVLSLVAALAAWDLSDFWRRLNFAAGPEGPVSPQREDLSTLERRHLAWLVVILLTGVGFSAVALQAHMVRFKFEAAAVLALLGAWGVTQLILRLRESK